MIKKRILRFKDFEVGKVYLQSGSYEPFVYSANRMNTEMIEQGEVFTVLSKTRDLSAAFVTTLKILYKTKIWEWHIAPNKLQHNFKIEELSDE